jgi:hypothetical protein
MADDRINFKVPHSVTDDGDWHFIAFKWDGKTFDFMLDGHLYDSQCPVLPEGDGADG